MNPSGLPQVLAEEDSDHVLARLDGEKLLSSRPRPISPPNIFWFDIIFLLLLTIASLISQSLLALFSSYHFLDFSFLQHQFWTVFFPDLEVCPSQASMLISAQVFNPPKSICIIFCQHWLLQNLSYLGTISF